MIDRCAHMQEIHENWIVESRRYSNVYPIWFAFTITFFLKCQSKSFVISYAAIAFRADFSKIAPVHFANISLSIAVFEL